MYEVEKGLIDECKETLKDIKGNFSKIVKVCEKDLYKRLRNSTDINIAVDKFFDKSDIEYEKIAETMVIITNEEIRCREQQALWKLQLS